MDLNDPEFAVMGDPSPASVRITVVGPARDLFAMGSDRPSVVVPVARVVAQDTAVLLRPLWVSIPGGGEVEVEEISPSHVRLSFEPVEVGAFDLSFRRTGSLPEGYSLAGVPQVNPALVRISGPASALAVLDSVYLVPLDLSGIRESGTFTLAVDTAGLGEMVPFPQEASVEVLVEETMERTFPEVPVELPVLASGPQLQARPASVTVTLVGARSLIEAVDPASLRLILPPGRASALSPGGEEPVRPTVSGHPLLVQALVDPEWVILRRPAGQ
ncbi:YbbR-like domain-containing protein [Gemmatimonadota bacterium]